VCVCARVHGLACLYIIERMWRCAATCKDDSDLQACRDVGKGVHMFANAQGMLAARVEQRAQQTII